MYKNRHFLSTVESPHLYRRYALAMNRRRDAESRPKKEGYPLDLKQHKKDKYIIFLFYWVAFKP